MKYNTRLHTHTHTTGMSHVILHYICFSFHFMLFWLLRVNHTNLHCSAPRGLRCLCLNVRLALHFPLLSSCHLATIFTQLLNTAITYFGLVHMGTGQWTGL